MSTPEKNWALEDSIWLQQMQANVVATHETGEVSEVVRVILDELLVCMAVYAQRGQAKRLEDRKVAGSSDWFGFSMPWPSPWHDDEARLTLYKRYGDATYELQYERFDVDPLSGDEQLVETETLAIGYPARGEVDRNGRRHMAPPHITQLPASPNRSPKPAPAELWQRADSILTVD